MDMMVGNRVKQDRVCLATSKTVVVVGVTKWR